jgi:hypothetical protein
LTKLRGDSTFKLNLLICHTEIAGESRELKQIKNEKNTNLIKNNSLKEKPIKINLVINLIKIIFIYSAKKIKANPPEEYSTLKPETNSDSPSAKSNGVRLVSARQETNHIIIKGKRKKAKKKIS